MQKIDEKIIIIDGKEWIERYNSFLYLKEDEFIYVWFRPPFWIGQDSSLILHQYYFKENAVRQSLNFRHNRSCCEIIHEELPLFISLETVYNIPHEPNNEDDRRGVYEGYVTYIKYLKIINKYTYEIYKNVGKQEYKMLHFGHTNSSLTADKVIVAIIDIIVGDKSNENI